MASFWDNVVGGVAESGLNWWGNQDATKMGQQRLDMAKADPNYQKQMGLGLGLLDQAQNFDEQAEANRLASQNEAQYASSDKAGMQGDMRMLQRRGLLGVGSYGAVPGQMGSPFGGRPQAVNPLLAARQVGIGTRQARGQADAMNQARARQNQLLSQGNTLTNAANSTLKSNLETYKTVPMPRTIVQNLTAGGRQSPANNIVSGVLDQKNKAGGWGNLINTGLNAFQGLFGSDWKFPDLGLGGEGSWGNMDWINRDLGGWYNPDQDETHYWGE